MRRFFPLFLALCAALPPMSAQPAQPRKPNVIFILADDLGWGDLSVYGHERLKTPNLDRMAAQGTLWTNFYVNGSVCSPSRAAFFTGQYPARRLLTAPQQLERRLQNLALIQQRQTN